MPMNEQELAIVRSLHQQIEHSIRNLRQAPWAERAGASAGFLETIHGAWWGRCHQDLVRYAAEIAELNERCGWVGRYAQVTAVERGGMTYRAPPKFFGGDARGLSQNFVLSVSLNHALPGNAAYVRELRDFQTRESCLRAHRDYFAQPYAYGRFFRARAKLLASYARSVGEAADPSDWRAVNARYAFYIERYPTISPSCAPAATDHAGLERDFFVMALNALTHKVVFGLLKPRAVLLAGKETWSLLPMRAPQPAAVRPDGHACPVTVDLLHAEGAICTCTVVRCNFLRTVYGPNSDAELQAVGRLLAVREDNDDQVAVGAR